MKGANEEVTPPVHEVPSGSRDTAEMSPPWRLFAWVRGASHGIASSRGAGSHFEVCLPPRLPSSLYPSVAAITCGREDRWVGGWWANRHADR